jgi:hypothetical protein
VRKGLGFSDFNVVAVKRCLDSSLQHDDCTWSIRAHLDLPDPPTAATLDLSLVLKLDDNCEGKN